MIYQRSVITAIMCVLLTSACLASHTGQTIHGFEVTHLPTGLAWDGRYLWLSDRDCDWIYAVNPHNGSIVDSVACPSFSPLGMAFGDRRLWISGYGENIIYALDPDKKKVTDMIGAPSSATTGLAWRDGSLWACDAYAKEIVEVDPKDGTPIRSFKAPSPYPNGLAFDGRYLWVSDRRRDMICMVEPETGWVILSFDSPGPYPRGLAWDGQHLWNVDYQQDSLYAILTRGDQRSVFESPKKARVEFTFKTRCQGPDPLEKCDVYLALPHNDMEHQQLLSPLVFDPEPAGIVEDKWGQEFAHFIISDLRPGETRKVRYQTSAQISRQQRFIIPEQVGDLADIPKDIRDMYTVDGLRLSIDNPVIQDAIKEAVGEETNPYCITRRILEYIGEKVEYERAGRWDTAPNVLERGTGSCSEYSFVFMAMARGAGLPTRFCAGIVERGDEASMDDAFHRWVEVYLPNYGWIPVDADAGDKEWQADCAKAIGSQSNRILITTIGGGDSEYAGWGYNYGCFHTYTGRTGVDVSAYADWAPVD